VAGVADAAGRKAEVPVIFHWGETDASIPKEHWEKVKQQHPNLTQPRLPAGHGFHCDERASYHKPSGRPGDGAHRPVPQAARRVAPACAAFSPGARTSRTRGSTARPSARPRGAAGAARGASRSYDEDTTSMGVEGARSALPRRTGGAGRRLFRHGRSRLSRQDQRDGDPRRLDLPASAAAFDMLGSVRSAAARCARRSTRAGRAGRPLDVRTGLAGGRRVARWGRGRRVPVSARARSSRAARPRPRRPRSSSTLARPRRARVAPVGGALREHAYVPPARPRWPRPSSRPCHAPAPSRC